MVASETQPATDQNQDSAAPHLVLAPSYTAPDGSVWAHKDYQRVTEAWAVEQYVPPIATIETFGDVESWAEYVKRFAKANTTHLTWNSQGLRAVLDYHDDQGSKPGRTKWLAGCPFTPSPEWAAWSKLASGLPIAHRNAVEFLEDHAPDIQAPDAAALMALLRSLRASVSAAAQTELRPDGSTYVNFSQDKNVRGGPGQAELPGLILIAIPVLKGHVDDNQHSVRYRMDVRLRASVDDSSHLSLRFSIPLAEQILEEVYTERVTAAKTLLGDSYQVLRAT